MQLKNAIEAMDDSTVIFVGSKTGFVFIGTKAEWNRDKDEINSWCEEFTRNEVEMATDSWEKAICSGLPMKDKYVNHDKWASDAFAAITKLGNAQRRLIDARKANKKFKPIEKRLVVEEYDRTVPGEVGRVLIVGGTEVGKYWLKDEYDTKSIVQSKEGW